MPLENVLITKRYPNLQMLRLLLKAKVQALTNHTSPFLAYQS